MTIIKTLNFALKNDEFGISESNAVGVRLKSCLLCWQMMTFPRSTWWLCAGMGRTRGPCSPSSRTSSRSSRTEWPFWSVPRWALGMWWAPGSSRHSDILVAWWAEIWFKMMNSVLEMMNLAFKWWTLHSNHVSGATNDERCVQIMFLGRPDEWYLRCRRRYSSSDGAERYAYDDPTPGCNLRAGRWGRPGTQPVKWPFSTENVMMFCWKMMIFCWKMMIFFRLKIVGAGGARDALLADLCLGLGIELLQQCRDRGRSGDKLDLRVPTPGEYI